MAAKSAQIALLAHTAMPTGDGRPDVPPLKNRFRQLSERMSTPKNAPSSRLTSWDPSSVPPERVIPGLSGCSL